MNCFGFTTNDTIQGHPELPLIFPAVLVFHLFFVHPSFLFVHVFPVGVSANSLGLCYRRQDAVHIRSAFEQVSASTQTAGE